MNIGFLTDMNGYRAPIHPESIEKYLYDVYLDKDIFNFLNYKESSQENVKIISKISDLDIVACVENIENKTIKDLKEGAALIGIFDFEKIEEIKNLSLQTNNKAKNFSGVANLIIDKSIKYDYVKKVMYTCASAGFKEYKFVVMGEEQ